MGVIEKSTGNISRCGKVCVTVRAECCGAQKRGLCSHSKWWVKVAKTISWLRSRGNEEFFGRVLELTHRADKRGSAKLVVKGSKKAVRSNSVRTACGWAFLGMILQFLKARHRVMCYVVSQGCCSGTNGHRCEMAWAWNKASRLIEHVSASFPRGLQFVLFCLFVSFLLKKYIFVCAESLYCMWAFSSCGRATL